MLRLYHLSQSSILKEKHPKVLFFLHQYVFLSKNKNAPVWGACVESVFRVHGVMSEAPERNEAEC